MPVSIFEGCGESCGYMAAICAIFAFGSFTVPLKFAKMQSSSSSSDKSSGNSKLGKKKPSSSSSSSSDEVNFFVMQSYKTTMCFLTSWFVILMGEEVRFSYWGIVSGLFWVPGASCGIYGVRNAGLAIAVGTWSSIQVLTSFLFGIVVFHEQVRSIPRASLAFLTLIVGLVGMARFAGMGSSSSSSSSSSSANNNNDPPLSSSPQRLRPYSLALTERMIDASNDPPPPSGNRDTTSPSKNARGRSKSPPIIQGGILSGIVRRPESALASLSLTATSSSMTPMEIDSSSSETGKRVAANIVQYSSLTAVNSNSSTAFDDEERVLRGARPKDSFDDHPPPPLGGTKRAAMDSFYRQDESSVAKEKNPRYKDYVVFCGGRFALHKQTVGILGAVINGAWGGCSLIPLHYARRDHGLSGAGYLISYAIGSAIVNTVMWILLFLYHYLCNPNTKHKWFDSVNALPKWHLEQLWWPGFLAGLLHSIGNFSSILAVSYLGQATGYSMCQLQLFISGLWAVFWFREIKQPTIIAKWFMSAGVAILGIVWLSWEHKSSGGAVH